MGGEDFVEAALICVRMVDMTINLRCDDDDDSEDDEADVIIHRLEA